MAGDDPDAYADRHSEGQSRVIVYPDKTDAHGNAVSTFSAILESPDSPTRPADELISAPDVATALAWARARCSVVLVQVDGQHYWAGDADNPFALEMWEDDFDPRDDRA